jgi:hypothetical protein
MRRLAASLSPHPPKASARFAKRAPSSQRARRRSGRVQRSRQGGLQCDLQLIPFRFEQDRFDQRTNGFHGAVRHRQNNGPGTQGEFDARSLSAEHRISESRQTLQSPAVMSETLESIT